MNFVDWAIVIIPMIVVIWAAIHSRKYVRGVVDYLAAGRIAGRYVISIGDMASALSVIWLVAAVEKNYQTGFAVAFWETVIAPVSIFLALSGFVVYRWRQTRCLSFGQFIELRYGSKFFRVFCATLRTLAETVTNAIGPAVATNFFIYYLGLPHRIMIFGVNLPCYAIIVCLCLILATTIIWPGGRISLLLTDSIQGLLCYPIFVVIVGYVILNFSWGSDVAPVMWNRVEGQCFMNPYDISGLRDFNIFAIVVTLLGQVLNRGGFIGNDSSSSGKTPHEQKMAGVLGAFRNGFAVVMALLVAVIVITFMNSPHFYGENRFGITNVEIRRRLSAKVLDEIEPDQAERAKVMAAVESAAAATGIEDMTCKMSQQKNPDTPYFDAVGKAFGETPEGSYKFQKFRSLFYQMMMPTLLSKIFPAGILGLFCLLMVMLLVSTDDARIFNAGTTLTQDVVLPFFKGHVPPKKHLLILRLTTLGVVLFFLIVSLFFAQLDYILMFTTIMTSLWLGGAAPIMLFGLYSRFGNLKGAWCAIIFGSGFSLFGLIMQRNWAMHIYPFLESMNMVASLDAFLAAVSAPFDPWIKWSMNPYKFPLNSFEVYFISMVLSIGGYVIASLLTYKPYNLDKLLHRGEYADPGTPEPVREKWTLRNVFSKLIGITSEHTRGDRIIAYVVFFYSIVYQVGIAFVAIVVWNLFRRWPEEWWTYKFLITMVIVPAVVGVVSTVWFTWGGIRDARQLFIDLKKRVEDDTDNGQVLQEEQNK